MRFAAPRQTDSSIARQLQEQIRQLERGSNANRGRTVTSGFSALDRILPAGGIEWGTIVEWLPATPGSGAGLLALSTARGACRESGPLVVVDPRRWFCPLPLFALGVDPAGVVIVHPANQRDEQWAIDQALRSPAIGSVLAWPERIDGRTFRRFQLAAEASGAIGCFVRPLSARGHPTWANLRLGIRPLPPDQGWRIQVEVLRSRSARQGNVTELVLDERSDHETHPLPLASELAHPAAPAIGA